MTFDIRDYLEQLVPHPKHRRAYLCPACGGGKLTFSSRNGAYSSHTCNCTHADIREALSPSCNPNIGLTAEEVAERKQRVQETRERLAMEEEHAHDRGQRRAQAEWDVAVPLTEADSALVEASYWTSKGLKPMTDVRIATRGKYRGWILAPMFLANGVLRNLQRVGPVRIDPKNGKRKADKDNVWEGQRKCCVGIIGGRIEELTNAEVVAIAEGPATAGSIHQLTGWPTLIGFGASGFTTAAALARSKAPAARLIICADNDEKGTGQRVAAAAARDYRGVVVMPPTVGQDFNDMHQAEGEEATRNLLMSALKAEPEATQPEQSQRFQKRPGTQALWGRRKLSHGRRMDCLHQCAQVQAMTERNTFRRKARLKKAAIDLELNKYVSSQDLSQMVLVAKDRTAGNCYRALTAADRAEMEWPDVDWLIPDLLPAGDLSIIGGRPKVGKTALAMAIAAAVLTQAPVAGFPPPAKARPVLLVTDDQSDADTRDSLQRLGIFNHPNLLWSRRFRLTEEDTDQLMEDIRRHPGALVIIDSLRSVSRSLATSENDPELGAVVYDLKAAVTDAGGSLMLIHHCNKSSSGTGVEALSGHSAIAGAANTIVTLHYVENNKGQPNKEAPQRRMAREGRTGKPLDWVISRNETGVGFSQVCTYGAWLEQTQEVHAAKKREDSRTMIQRRILTLLEAQPGRCWTVREVVEGLQLKWEKRGQEGDGRQVRNALKALCGNEELQRYRAGNEYTYTALAKHNPSHVLLTTVQHLQQPQHPLPDSVSGVAPKVQQVQHDQFKLPLEGGVAGVADQVQQPKPGPHKAAAVVAGVAALTDPCPSSDRTADDLQLLDDPAANSLLLEVFRQTRDLTDAEVHQHLGQVGLNLPGPQLVDLRCQWADVEDVA